MDGVGGWVRWENNKPVNTRWEGFQKASSATAQELSSLDSEQWEDGLMGNRVTLAI
jgi:hypothetical protein